MTIKGEFLWGSNYTFLAQVENGRTVLPVVYKPSRGEQLLWDFPEASLAKREVAAYKVSEALGWDIVPPTVFRSNGPLGSGSLQLFVDHDPDYHYFNFSDEDKQRLRPTVLFDIVVNNADRKGSHIIKGKDRHLWLIDHGICFHVEDKLRTVVWDFVGQPIPNKLIDDLSDFNNKLKHAKEASSALLNDFLCYIDITEFDAMITRIDRLVQNGCFPVPDLNRRVFPWPQI